MSWLILTAAIGGMAGAQPAVAPAEGETATSAPAQVGAQGYLGFKKEYREEDGQGQLVVRQVRPGSPTEKAGLLEGDVVVAFNGVGFRFADNLELSTAFDWIRPGDRIDLTVLRGGEEMTVELVAAVMPAAVAEEWTRWKVSVKADQHQNEISEQLGTLMELVAAGRFEIAVVRDAATGKLECSAAGHPPEAFAHMETMMRGVGAMAEFLDLLKPGDGFKLAVWQGPGLQMKILDPPPYLADFGPPAE